MPQGQGYHPNPAEAMRLTRLIVDLKTKGYRQVTIAEALGINPRTVSSHLHRAGVLTGRHNQYRDPEHLPPLGTIEWRDPPPDSEPMAVDYKMSLPARSVANQVRHLQAINGVVRLAFDVTHAREANDYRWISQVRADLDEMAEYTRRLIAVIDDEDTRARARTDHGERDDIRPTLRRVAG